MGWRRALIRGGSKYLGYCRVVSNLSPPPNGLPSRGSQVGPQLQASRGPASVWEEEKEVCA